MPGWNNLQGTHEEYPLGNSATPRNAKGETQEQVRERLYQKHMQREIDRIEALQKRGEYSPRQHAEDSILWGAHLLLSAAGVAAAGTERIGELILGSEESITGGNRLHPVRGVLWGISTLGDALRGSESDITESGNALFDVIGGAVGAIDNLAETDIVEGMVGSLGLIGILRTGLPVALRYGMRRAQQHRHRGTKEGTQLRLERGTPERVTEGVIRGMKYSRQAAMGGGALSLLAQPSEAIQELLAGGNHWEIARELLDERAEDVEAIDDGIQLPLAGLTDHWEHGTSQLVAEKAREIGDAAVYIIEERHRRKERWHG